MAFALQESYSIYGGNLKSTMAGEFSFSISLSLGVLGLGLLANAMRTGRYRSWAAIVLALSIVSHGIVAIYIALAALVITLIHMDNRKRVMFGLGLGTATVLLSAFWIGPFLGNHEFMTDMKYGGRPDGARDSFWDMFFPFPDPIDIMVSGLAIVGFIAAVARRHLTGTALGVIGLFTVALVYLTRESLPIIGLLWNPRLLPLLYLVEFMLAMVGLVEVVTLVGNVWRDRRAGATGGLGTRIAAFSIGAVAVSLIFAFFYEVLPGGERITARGETVYAWGPFQKNAHPDNDDAYQKAQGNGWARYNFEGYEGRPHFAEYADVVQTLQAIGDDPSRGCGRMLWENNGDNGEYGTTMAFMLLPFWTDGCISSMEGLFFEASGTTPYHFITAAAMSESSSNPVRELRYTNNDADIGVRHLQDLGVRYTMVRTDAAKREARLHDDLELLDTVGPWEIFQVADSDIVVPLDVQPVIVNERSGDQRERHLEVGTSWFQNPDDWTALPADDGPDTWQRLSVEVDDERRVPDINKCARQAEEAAAQAAADSVADAAEAAASEAAAATRRFGLGRVAHLDRFDHHHGGRDHHDRSVRPRHPGQTGRRRRAERVDPAHRVARGHRQRRRDRPAGRVVPGRSCRRARSGEGQLLPQLGGRGRRGSVPGGPQLHGGHPDRQRGSPLVRPQRLGHRVLRRHDRRAGPAGVVPAAEAMSTSTATDPSIRMTTTTLIGLTAPRGPSRPATTMTRRPTRG